MRLLINEPPLQVLPSLATAIGPNKAIVLQILHQELMSNPVTIEGKHWFRSSYENWKKKFPFWSEKTIRRIFRELEKEELVISTMKFNSCKLDKTKWYTVNYEKLQEVLRISKDNSNFTQGGQSEEA